jgi:LysM repeat protein
VKTPHPIDILAWTLCLLCSVTLAACSAAGSSSGAGMPAPDASAQPLAATRAPAPAALEQPAPRRPAAPGAQPPAATPELPAATPAQPAEPFVYHVQAGDTLLALALRYGVTVADIMTANQLADPDTLALDQELIIPVGGLPDALVANVPVVPTFPPMPAGPFTTYDVQSGDTLLGIAQRFGASTNDLIAANRLTNPDALYPGQSLLVPASAWPAAQEPPAPAAPPAATAVPIPTVPGSTPEQYRAWMEEAHGVHPYAEPVDWMWSVMMCESGGYSDLIGHGKYYGLFQYLPGTWSGDWNPYRDSSIYDPRAQIFATAKAWQDGHQSWWRGCWPG